MTVVDEAAALLAERRLFGLRRLPDGSDPTYSLLAGRQFVLNAEALEEGRLTWRHVMRAETCDVFGATYSDRQRRNALLNVAVTALEQVLDIDSRAGDREVRRPHLQLLKGAA